MRRESKNGVTVFTSLLLRPSRTFYHFILVKAMAPGALALLRLPPVVFNAETQRRGDAQRVKNKATIH